MGTAAGLTSERSMFAEVGLVIAAMLGWIAIGAALAVWMER